ncbi:ABC transporter ATP-binding protein [Micromonospora sp. ANENR4]|nr:ABC transporter ATP-binding protein [Micromonospora sp. ANENR4]
MSGVSGLVVEDLVVKVHDIQAVKGVSFEIGRGRRMGLIGESGCGKSLTALALMGLLPHGVTASGRVLLNGRNLLDLSDKEMCAVRGNDIAMVFQEPMTALNPLMRVGNQVAESLRLHKGMSRAAASARAVELLERVQLPEPDRTARKYPHQLSGGQRQRVVLAIALACDPAVLVADEPTTALDVTVQAEMLRLMDTLVREEGASLLLITHDLPVVASICEELLVMYGGSIVEHGDVATVFDSPRHPYTAGLRASTVLESTDGSGRLSTIPGRVPSLGSFPTGCVYRNRCPRADDVCGTVPLLTAPPGSTQRAACHHPIESDQPLGSGKASA